MPDQLIEQHLDPVVEEAQSHGYLTVSAGRITYHCSREYSDNYDDPEEKVRARTYSWLILRRSYVPNRMDLEVTVPRRTPSDRADIVLYRDDACRDPYLVVENKEEQCTRAEQNQGIEQVFGNANSLRAPYMLFDYGGDSVLFDVGNFPPRERQQNRMGKREAIPAGYGTPSQFPLVAKGTTDIAPVSAPELEMKVRRAHGLLWAGGRRDPLKAFDEWSKLLFAKIYDERQTPNGEPRKFQVGARETDAEVAARVRALYTQARRRDPSIFAGADIDLPDNKIKDVVHVIQEVGLSLMPIDGLGHAFEHFFSTIFRGDLGQYFTRRELVRFTVAMVKPNGQDFVIDPTCGSGGFLLEALIQVWHYIDTSFAGQADVERQKYDFAHENLFGIETNDILGRVCQTNLLLHKDGHTNIETNRTCLDARFSNHQIRPDSSLFTVVLGNPPFGSDVEEDDADDLGSNTLENFELGRGRVKVKSEQVILERSFQFLQPGGKLAMVIPDGMLNNPGGESSAFRRYLLRTARIDAIVSLPDHAFRKSGAQNKTSILFATKYTMNEKERFERAYQEELDRRVQENTAQPNLSNGADTVSEAEDGGDVRTIMELEDLAGPELSVASLKAAIGRLEYSVFLAEADQLGYNPAGASIEDNDLYSMTDDLPDPQDEGTILGQWTAYQRNPATYEGAAAPNCMGIKASVLLGAHPTYRMDPKFHLFKREELNDPPSSMRRVRLGSVLQLREDVVTPALEPDREFLVPTLTQEGELLPREAGKGKNPPAWFGQYFKEEQDWHVLHTEDLVYSRIDLWKGCVTIIPEEYDGAIVTNEFPIYKVDQEQLDPHYLKLILRTRYFQRAIRAITTGHSNRRRTQHSDFANLTIYSCPTIERCNYVSARLSRVASKPYLLKGKIIGTF